MRIGWRAPTGVMGLKAFETSSSGTGEVWRVDVYTYPRLTCTVVDTSITNSVNFDPADTQCMSEIKEVEFGVAD